MVEPVGEHGARLELSGPREILDAEAPGWLGSSPRARRGRSRRSRRRWIRARVRAGPGSAFAIEVDPEAEPTALTRLSTIPAWKFRGRR
jgi:hypothetical protein